MVRIAQTISCSSFGGTGSVTIDAAADGSSTITYNACSFSGATFNGVIAQSFTGNPGTAGSTVTQTYRNLTVAYAGSPAETINGSTTCTYGANNSVSCTQAVNGYNVTSGYQLSNSGATTTVSQASMNGSSSFGSATYTYSGWVYNGTTGRATAGSAVLDYGNGNKIEVTAGATAYTVKITFNGTTTTYTV